MATDRLCWIDQHSAETRPTRYKGVGRSGKQLALSGSNRPEHSRPARSRPVRSTTARSKACSRHASGPSGDAADPRDGSGERSTSRSTRARSRRARSKPARSRPVRSKRAHSKPGRSRPARSSRAGGRADRTPGPRGHCRHTTRRPARRPAPEYGTSWGGLLATETYGEAVLLVRTLAWVSSQQLNAFDRAFLISRHARYEGSSGGAFWPRRAAVTSLLSGGNAVAKHPIGPRRSTPQGSRNHLAAFNEFDA